MHGPARPKGRRHRGGAPGGESARRNARRNGINNVEFHTAPVEEKLPALVAQGLRPDVVVLDPPRKGVEPAVVQAVLEAAPAGWCT